jgi:hypothetical protein
MYNFKKIYKQGFKLPRFQPELNLSQNIIIFNLLKIAFIF